MHFRFSHISFVPKRSVFKGPEGDNAPPQGAEKPVVNDFDTLAKKYEDIKERFLLYRDAGKTVEKVQLEGASQKAKDKAAELKTKIDTAKANEDKYKLDPGALMNQEAALVHRAHNRLLKILEGPVKQDEPAKIAKVEGNEPAVVAAKPKAQPLAEPKPVKAPPEARVDYDKQENRIRSYNDAAKVAQDYLADTKPSPDVKKYAAALTKMVEDYRRKEGVGDGWAIMGKEVNDYRKALTALAEGKATDKDQKLLQKLEKAVTPEPPKAQPAKVEAPRKPEPPKVEAPKPPKAQPAAPKPTPKEPPKQPPQVKKEAPSKGPDASLIGFMPQIKGPSVGPSEDSDEPKEFKGLYDLVDYLKQKAGVLKTSEVTGIEEQTVAGFQKSKKQIEQISKQENPPDVNMPVKLQIGGKTFDVSIVIPGKSLKEAVAKLNNKEDKGFGILDLKTMRYFSGKYKA